MRNKLFNIYNSINSIKSMKTRQKIKYSFLVVLILSFLFSLIYIYNFYFNEDKNYNIYKNIKSIAEDNGDDSFNDVLDQNEKINFDALWNINSDIYAYIKIPGTDISYPIVQSKTDNSYYLNHTIEGQAGYPGSIYTENYNTKTFSDRNTLIYGHNMNNGTMFSQLFNFSERDFFDQNQFIYIILPNKILKYHIFAAFMFDDRHIMGSYDFTNPINLEKFIEDSRVTNSYSNYNDSIQVNSNNKIITLSTCMPNDMPDNRWIVEAVLENE